MMVQFITSIMSNSQETLAKIFAEIHDYSFVPFYGNTHSNYWAELNEESDRFGKNISKEFFRKMAAYAINIYRNAENKHFALAEILFCIHSSSLVPFYISEEDMKRSLADPDDYWYRNNWNNLEMHSNNDELVDKNFFLEMAMVIGKQI
jgi:hypothetical protein